MGPFLSFNSRVKILWTVPDDETPTLSAVSFTVILASCLTISATAATLAFVAAFLGWPGRGSSFSSVLPPLNFLCHLKIDLLETTDVPCIWHSSLYICETWNIQTNVTFNVGPNFKACFVFDFASVRVECIWLNQLAFNNFWKTERTRPKFYPILENYSLVKSPQFPRAPYSHMVWWAISDTIKWTPLV